MQECLVDGQQTKARHESREILKTGAPVFLSGHEESLLPLPQAY